MTIIIAARLDDGRKIMMADGLQSNTHDSIVGREAIKIERIDSNMRKRIALVGASGDAVAQQIACDVIMAYMCAPEPKTQDLFYRFGETCKAHSIDWDATVLAWLPNQGGEHDLVLIDSKFFPSVIVERNYGAAGCGSVEARSALLGSALNAYDDTAGVERYDYLKAWRPSMRDVDIAYGVACEMDPFCGGKRTILTL